MTNKSNNKSLILNNISTNLDYLSKIVIGWTMKIYNYDNY